MQDYVNFDVLITRDSSDSAYALTVHDTPTGSIEEILTIPLEDFAEVQSRNLAELNKDEVKELGYRLYAAIFGNAAGDLLSRNLTYAKGERKGLRLRLGLPPELAGLPWEFLVDPALDNYFSLSSDTPVVRHLPVVHPGLSSDSSMPLRVLVIIPSSELDENVPLNVEDEWEVIKKAFSPLTEQKLVDVVRLQPPTLDNLQHELQTSEYHVIHFAGHGGPNGDGQIGLYFDDDAQKPQLVLADTLSSIITDHDTLALAYLNACQSGQSTQYDHFTGIAQRLVQGGLRAAIALQSPILDTIAIVLAGAFYRALTNGYTIDAALAEARKSVFQYHPTQWGIPILFSRVDGPLVPADDPESELGSASEFALAEIEVDRIHSIVVRPDTKHLYRAAKRILQTERFLILKGRLGVGKRTLATELARDLAQEYERARIMRTFRSTPLRSLQGLRNCIIIIPDALGLLGWERQSIEEEIPLIEGLCNQNHVILTTDDGIMDQAVQGTRLREWARFNSCQLEITSKSYSLSEYWDMLEKHVNRAEREGRIRQRQAKLAKDLLKSDSVLNRNDASNQLFTPLDIGRLVDERLPRLSKRSDLSAALSQLGNLQQEISAWFSAISDQPMINDDLQCFVFTLAVFDGFERKQLWLWYQKTVEILRSFNASLSVRPLGTMARLTEPYVSIENDVPTFSHPSYQRVVLKAAARSYREYFLAALPILAKACLPDLSNTGSSSGSNTKSMIMETHALREAVTHAYAIIAEDCFDESIEYVESLANHIQGAISALACDVIVAAARNPIQRKQVLGLLRRWTNNRKPEGRAKRWVAAVSYGKLYEVGARQAFRGLKALANDRGWDKDHRDENRFVRSVIPKSVRPYISMYPEDCKQIYKALAADDDEYTQREVSNELRSIAYYESGFVEDIFDNWSTLPSRRRLWTLIRACIIIPGPLKQTRLALLTEYIEHELHLCNKAMNDALSYDDLRPDRAWRLLGDLIEYRNANAERIAMLAILIEDKAPELSWERLENWAAAPQAILNLAAAHIVSHWRMIYPEKSREVVGMLAAHPNMEIANLATLPPRQPIPPSFPKAIARMGLEKEGESVESESDKIPFDFSVDILG